MPGNLHFSHLLINLRIVIIRSKFVGREMSNQIDADLLKNIHGAGFGVTAITDLVVKAMRLPGAKQTVLAKMGSSLKPAGKLNCSPK